MDLTIRLWKIGPNHFGLQWPEGLLRTHQRILKTSLASPEMNRIAVIGTSCAGKSTLSSAISEKLSIPYIGLDNLHWLPNWVERPDDEFLDLVEEAVSDAQWVVDGNYAVAREVIWPKATTIVWLDYPFALVLWRAISRSIRRAITREKLFSGNVESFRQSFFSKDSIILWVIQTHHSNRRKYQEIMTSEAVRDKNVVIITSQRQADDYLSAMC